MNPLNLLIKTIIILIFINYFFLKKKKINNFFFQNFSIFIIQILGLYLWICFDPFLIVTNYNHGFQFFTYSNLNIYLNLTYTSGIDSIALIFILLTIFIFNLCIYSIQTIRINQFYFFLILLILELILILVFPILDFFIFYLFFEGSLIPMFLIIGIWGSRSRKIKATFYFFLYTMTTALLTLISLIYIILQTGSTFFPDILNYNFTINEQKILWFLIFLTFATKIPIIPIHIWLPEAHVEAPTVGSVILASILLKLGGFGFIRYLIPFFPFANNFFLPLTYTIGICSVLYASFITIRQIDLKRIIAYSSIAHMNMVILGIFSNNIFGIEGAIYLMIGHGIISAALFFLVGAIYERYHSRLLRYYSGLISIMPLFGSFFLIFLLGNIGFPGTSNFIGEFLILLGVFYKNPLITCYIGIGIILSAVYSIWLYNRIFFGTLQIKYNFFFFDLTIFEFYIFSFLLLIMFLLGINSNFLLNICLLNIEQFLNYSTNF